MKPGKLQRILDNKQLGNDMVISFGDESLTLGEMRDLAADDPTIVQDLEQREQRLVAAQGALGDTVQKLSERLGIPVEQLISGDLEGIKPRGGKNEPPPDDTDPLSELDPKVLAALEKRYGRSAVDGAIEGLKKELGDTKRALALALKVNMEDYYTDRFDRLSKDLPEGVSLKLADVLKYADENNIREKQTGRYNLSKAIGDMTVDARIKAARAEGFKEGESTGRNKALVEGLPQPGARRGELLKPPVDSKGRTHTIEHQLNEAMQDTDIQRMLTGAIAEA